MSKKKGPALYELINSRQAPDTSKRQDSASKQKKPKGVEEDLDLEQNLLTPGSSIRVSIGTVGVLVAVTIALFVIAYTMGFRKGSAVAREDYEMKSYLDISQSFAEPSELTAVDPTSLESTPPVQPPSIENNVSWGPVFSDPRVINSYYFTLMQTTKTGAQQLAAFCRQKGLETYVVSGNNTRLYRVIALPGSPDRHATSLSKVQAHVYAIGQEWAKTSTGRGSDLKDAYLSIKKK